MEDHRLRSQHDRKSEAKEAHGEGDRRKDRRSDDEPRRRKGRNQGPVGAGERRAREAGVSSVQGHRAGHQIDADPPRRSSPEDPLRRFQAHQPPRLHRRRRRRRRDLQAPPRHPRQPQEVK